VEGGGCRVEGGGYGMRRVGCRVSGVGCRVWRVRKLKTLQCQSQNPKP
jgi:hypothetical protein